MWNDAHRHINIEAKRTYAAGFSGGARVAILYAKLCEKCISAVIANGAGFPRNLSPSKEMDFSFFLSAGDADFNYPEVIELADRLKKIPIPTRTFVFHGTHGWMPTDGWRQAFTWIEVQGMKRGVRQRQTPLIQTALERFTSYAQALRREGDELNALRAYETNVADFSGSMAALNELKQSKSLEKQAKQERKDFDEAFSQHSDTNLELGLIVQGQDDAARALRDLRARMASLRKKIDSDGESRAVVARRHLSGILLAVSDTAEYQMNNRKYESALDLYQTLADFARKPAAGAHLGKARALAKMGKERDALAEVRTALEGGVTEADVRSAEELAPLFQKPEWQALFSSSKVAAPRP